ncbi:DNA polymerase III subunit delta [Singulisphaera acidiphila]|uniref:DNA polymerase III subunit delta n=1 Tax=Singulisphaera acidiphila (strain ATCC BAA-1392 / DSM 18658 / VKM B-2454 / MOB10) TaxID=886293 RepID=L0DF04_SINAD|nr:DNA polymerase III subunit delta [Singulisphaera acidiphila]AGA27261.1 DNA polymerase III, delta subunit [Singulisphaera acidiphila DSM 18658]
MHAIDFLKDPSKVPVKPVYAVFGDDVYLRRESLASIRRLILHGDDEEMGLTRFAGEHASLADVIDEVRTVPIFAKRKVVIVDGADPFVTAHRKELEAYVEHPSTAGVLVLAVKLWPSNTKLAKNLEKAGLSIECKGPSEKVLGAWLVHMAKTRSEVRLDSDAASLLIELVGTEVGLLISEIEKLAVFVGAQARIQRDVVARMVGAGRIEDVWNVLTATTTGRGEVALDLLDRLLGAGEHPIGLLAAMSASLRKVHHAGQLRRNRMPLDNACEEAGIKFGRDKVRLQHAHLGPRRVDQLPRLLLQADLDLKGASNLPPRVVIEKLLIELARPRQD